MDFFFFFFHFLKLAHETSNCISSSQMCGINGQIYKPQIDMKEKL